MKMKDIANICSLDAKCRVGGKSQLTAKILFILSLILLGGLNNHTRLRAEGTRQAAPSPNDIVMLLTSRPDFSNFAAFNGPVDSRLFVTVNDPAAVIYFGLSSEFSEDGEPLAGLDDSRYRFRIRRLSDGAVVHGPFLVDRENANVNTWQEALFGNYDVTYVDPITGQRVFEFRPGQVGDYFIEFQDVGNDGSSFVHIGYWDFTVVEGGAVKNGRLWSRNWALRTPVQDGTDPAECVWDREFNGTFYSYTTDGFVSKIDFQNSGLQGLAFSLAFNSTGPGTSGNLAEDRKSIPNRNATRNAAEHKIFVNEPCRECFPDGECGTVFAGTTFQCLDEGGYCLPVVVSRAGQVEIILDFNRDGDVDNDEQDIILVYDFVGDDLSTCIPWDGLKGDGTPVGFGDTINLIINYTQGVQHWAVYDVEFLKNGFCVEPIRPLCGNQLEGTERLYWDDRNIPEESGTSQPKDGRDGCDCGDEGCRTWINFSPNAPCDNLDDGLTTGYGDRSTINTWWFANIRSRTEAGIPFLTCQITGRDSICAGETTEFLVEVSPGNTPGLLYTYTWSGPGGFSSSEPSTGAISLPGEYRVTVTDPLGCSTTCSLILNVAEAPQLSIAEVIDASCPNLNDGAITVTASGGFGQFTYSIDGVNYQSSNTFIGLLPGDYNILLRDAGGCEAALPATVGVEDPVQVNYVDTLLLCPGDRAQIGPPANPDYLYQWTPATGLDDPTAPNPIVSVDQTTTYVVSVRSRPTSTCLVQDTVVVLVSDQVGLTVSGGGESCAPTATFTASTSAPASFTWLNAAGEVIGNEAELTVSVAGDAIYRVRAETPAGCTEEIEVAVKDDLIDVNIPEVVAACLGETIIINTTNNRPEQELSYQWSPTELIVPGTENSPTPEIIPQAGENIVRVTIDNQFGCTYTDSVLVVIIDPDFTLDFEYTIQCNGATVDFTNTSTDVNTFLWRFGDPNNPNATSRETNPTYTYSEPGTYTVTLSVGYDVDCATSIQKEIVIVDPQIIANFTYALTDCGPDGATIAFQDASRNSFNNTIGWSWSFSNGASSTEQNPLITINQNDPLAVELTIFTANNCQATKKDTLPVRLPKISLPDTLASCTGEAVALNPGGDDSLQYEWTPASGLDNPTAANPRATPSVTTTYTATVTGFVGDQTCSVVDQVTVVIPDPINLTVSDDLTTCGEDVVLQASTDVPTTITWRNSQGVTVGTGPEITVNPAKIEVYTVIARDLYECTAVDSVTVTDNGVDVRLLTPDQEVVDCGPQTIQVEVENLDPQDTLTFLWSPADRVSDPTAQNPVAIINEGTTTFIVRVENQFGCVDSLRFRATALPFATGLPDTVYACAGVPTPLNPGYDPDYTYTWTPTTNLDLTTPGNPIFTGNANATYTVIVKGQSANTDCEVETTVEVIVLPDPEIELSNDTTLCVPEEITLMAISNVEGLTISWYDDPSLSNPIGSGSSLTLTPPVGDNTYYVVADQSQACSAFDSIQVRTLDFNPDDLFESIVSVCENTPTPINPNGNPEYDYVWDPTDGLDLTQPWNPVATLATDATYGVTVTDPVSGCSASGEVLAVVSPALNLEVSDDIILCEPAPVTLTASTAVLAAIRWYDNAELTGPPVATGNEFTFTPIVGIQTFYVVADDGSVCTETESVTVTVAPDFESGITSPLSICANTPTLISLNPSLEYDWSPTTGLDLSDPANPVITLDTDVAYRIIVTDPATGCFKEEELLVIVSPPLGLITSGDTTLCEPGTVTLTATTSEPTIIRWFDNPNFEGEPLATGGTLEVTPNLGTATYYVLAEGAGGCSESTSVSVTVFDLPADSGLPSEPITGCAGETVPLPVNPDFNYSWSPETGLDLSDPANPVIIITEDITYTVTIDDPATGCTAEAEVIVDASPAVELTVSNDTTLCEITELTLQANTDIPATIEWFDNPEFSGTPLATGSEFIVTPPAGTTTYYVRAQSPDSCSQTDSVAVTVIDLPGTSGLPDDPIELCAGDSTTLDLNGNYTYTWTPSTGVDLTDPLRPVIIGTGDMTYTVLIEDAATGCSAEAQVVVKVNPRPNLEVSNDTTLCELMPLILTASTDVEATISWYDRPDLSGDPIATGGQATVTPPVGTTTYYVRAMSNAGCAETDSVQVSVFDPLADSGLKDQADAIDGNGDLIFNLCAGDSRVLNLNPEFTYEWDPVDGLDLSDPANPVIIGTGDVTYTVTITDPASGCTVSATVQVRLAALLNLTLSGDTILCEPGTATLMAATDLPAVINWYDNRDFSGDPLATGNTFSPEVTAEKVTYYVLAQGENGCTETDSIMVRIQDVFIESGLDTLDDRTLIACHNEPLRLRLAPGFEYQWDPTDGLDLSDPANPSITLDSDRSYSVTATDPVSGCSTSAQFNVSVLPPLNLNAEPDTTLCAIMEIPLRVTTDVPVSEVIWATDPDFTNTIGQGSPLQVTPPLGTTIYYVRAIDENGCSSIDSVRVDNRAIIAELPPVTLCEPAETAELEVILGDPTQTVEYFWGPEPAIISDVMSGPTATVDLTVTNEFFVELSNEFCTTQLATMVTVINLPDSLEITAEPDTIFVGESSQITVTGCTDCTYDWSPSSSLDLSDPANPVARPNETTEYTVVVGTQGCFETLQLSIVVEEFICGLPNIYIPNAFTPNGDGVNDVVRVRGENITDMLLIIFSRWGQKVFESNSQNKHWDGTFDGRELPPDVYGYYLEVSCGNGEKYRTKGNITLLR